MGNAHLEHLSPSASSRWMNCPFSTVYDNVFYMIKDKTPYRNEARMKGENAHEKAAKLLLAKIEGKQENTTGILEIDQDIKDYVDYVFNRYASLCEKYPNTCIQIERMVDSSKYAVNCFGTADVFIVGGHDLIVVDLKTGSEEIQARKNSQLMIYALGIFDIYGKIYNEISNVELIIFQPRYGGAKKWNTSLSELLEWGNNVLRPAASHALDQEYRSHKCGTWCRNCKGADYCEEYLQQLYGYEEQYGELSKENLMRIRSLIDEANNIKDQIDSLKLEGFPSLHEIPKTNNYIRSIVDQLQGEINLNKVLHGKEPKRTRSIRKSTQYRRKAIAIDPETGEHMDITSVEKFSQVYNKACQGNRAHPMIVTDKDNNLCILASLYWWKKDMQKLISDCEEYFVNRSTFWSSHSGKTYYLVEGSILGDYELYVRHIRRFLDEYDLILEYITRVIDVIDNIAESKHDRDNAPEGTTIDHDREAKDSALKQFIRKFKKQEG